VRFVLVERQGRPRVQVWVWAAGNMHNSDHLSGRLTGSAIGSASGDVNQKSIRQTGVRYMNEHKHKTRVHIFTVSILISIAVSAISAGSVDEVVSQAEINRINEIRAAMGTEVNWTVGTTSVSGLSAEAKRQLGGAMIAQVPDDADIIRAPAGVAVPYGTYDWRNKDGKNWMTPVKNQGSCGSCWAFGAVGAVEAKINIDANNPSMDVDLSEQHLVASCCSNCGDCGGGYPTGALNYIKSPGLPNETCFPYKAHNCACAPCDGWEDHVWTIEDYKPVDHTTDAFKTALRQHGPMVVVIRVPDDWFYYTGGIYEPVSSSDEVGWANHCVVLVGYNDPGGYWIIKNSWGPNWGEDGYAKVKYGNLEQYHYGYVIVNTTCPSAPVISVDPEEIDLSIPVGDVSSVELSIANSGDTELSYTISDDAVWLTESQASGTVAQGGAANITVTCNTTGMVAGSYGASIVITGNAVETVTVPVNLTVVGVVSTDSAGIAKSGYAPGDCVYVRAYGLVPDTDYWVYIQADPVNDMDWLTNTQLDDSGVEIVTSDSTGQIVNTLIWQNVPESPPNAKWCIVFDSRGAGSAGRYNVAYDALGEFEILTIPTGVTVSIGSTTGSSGGTATVPISLANALGITGLSPTIAYDPSVVQVLGISANTSVVAITMQGVPNINNTAGLAKLSLTSASDGITVASRVPVADVTFELLGANGMSTDLSFVDTGMMLANTDFEVFAPNSIEDGRIAVLVKGDFNGNDVIDIGDVARIVCLRAGSIATTPEDLAIGDFNGNGEIDMEDVTTLANYQLGNIDTL